MKIEEAKDILENVVADEVVGIYCKEIQKETDCSKNCEKEDCFIQQAIDTVIAELHALQNLLDEKNEEIEHLQKENEELKEHNRKYLEAEIFSAKQIKEIEKQRNEHYIHKDKIREKIEELKNSEEFYQNFPYDYMGDILINILKIDLLKEE